MLAPAKFYAGGVTKLLENAVDAVRRLPAADQNEIAHVMLSLARMGEGGPEAIDPTHLADVLEGLAQAQRREFATEAEVSAAFARFNR